MRLHHLAIAGGVAYLTARFMRAPSASTREVPTTTGDTGRTNERLSAKVDDAARSAATGNTASGNTTQVQDGGSHSAPSAATPGAGQTPSKAPTSSTLGTSQGANASTEQERPALGFAPATSTQGGNAMKPGVTGVTTGLSGGG